MNLRIRIRIEDSVFIDRNSTRLGHMRGLNLRVPTCFGYEEALLLVASNVWPQLWFINSAVSWSCSNRILVIPGTFSGGMPYAETESPFIYVRQFASLSQPYRIRRLPFRRPHYPRFIEDFVYSQRHLKWLNRVPRKWNRLNLNAVAVMREFTHDRKNSNMKFNFFQFLNILQTAPQHYTFIATIL